MTFDEEETSEEVYNSFWKDLVETDGVLDKQKLMDELYDFYFLIGEVSKVYVEITDGAISKPNTYASEVIAVANDCTQRAIDEAVDEALLEFKCFLEVSKSK